MGFLQIFNTFSVQPSKIFSSFQHAAPKMPWAKSCIAATSCSMRNMWVFGSSWNHSLRNSFRPFWVSNITQDNNNSALNRNQISALSGTLLPEQAATVKLLRIKPGLRIKPFLRHNQPSYRFWRDFRRIIECNSVASIVCSFVLQQKKNWESGPASSRGSASHIVW